MDWGAPDFGTAYVFTYEESSSKVYVDIQPGSCPNPVNTRSKGVLPVALLGTETFDVNRIDLGTIRVSREGVDGEVAPTRSGYEDVAAPFEGDLCGCHKLKGDGNTDLSLKFNIQELVTALRLKEVAGATITLTVTGNLKEEFGGTPFQGQDCIRVSK